jgi:hypothetical protein
MLSLQYATPLAPLASPFISEPSRTITLPFLTHFSIHALAKDCALALAHLLLPTLTRLHVDVKSRDEEGEDVRLVIPYVARNVYVLQDIKPIRSILIAGERTCAEVYAWAMPDVDAEVCDLDTLGDTSRSASLLFSARGKKWRNGVDSAILDALLTLLPVNSVSTFTAQNRTRLSKEFWLRHAPRWPLLEQARLVPTSIRGFRELLAEDAPPDGPRLPSLTQLIILDVTSTTLRTVAKSVKQSSPDGPRLPSLTRRILLGAALFSAAKFGLMMCHLCDMEVKRAEQGVPLELLMEGPLDAPPMAMDEFARTEYCDEFEYDDGRKPWYGDMDGGEDGSEDEDEDEDEEEDEDEDEDEDVDEDEV